LPQVGDRVDFFGSWRGRDGVWFDGEVVFVGQIAGGAQQVFQVRICEDDSAEGLRWLNLNDEGALWRWPEPSAEERERERFIAQECPESTPAPEVSRERRRELLVSAFIADKSIVPPPAPDVFGEGELGFGVGPRAGVADVSSLAPGRCASRGCENECEEGSACCPEHTHHDQSRVPDWPNVANLPPVRVCKAFECATILGEGVESELCAIHRRAARDAYDASGMLGRDVLDALMGAPGKCARKGCDRERELGSVWCSSHARVAATVGATDLSCDNLPAVECTCIDDDDHGRRVMADCPVHGGTPPESKVTDAWVRGLMMEAYEFAWQKMADDPENDPVTVARCKRIHDLQLDDLGVRS
jgi:hypothetical protein